MSVNQIYDPFEFMSKVELFTFTILGSFVTWKLMNTIYDHFFSQVIDVAIDGKNCDEYVLKVGKNYIRIGIIINDFIKWIVVIIVLMMIYNALQYKQRYQKN